MKNQLQVFNFNAQQVRVIGTPDQPWFVAADVCQVLGIVNSRDALSRLDDDEKGVGNTDTLGGSQVLATVSESGLYALIFRSRKTEAKVFRKWVTGEVLPSIRKSGAYGNATTTSAQTLFRLQQSTNEMFAAIIEKRVRENGPFHGKAEEVFGWITEDAPSEFQNHPIWPKTRVAFGRRLNRAGTALVQRGVGIWRNQGKLTIWRIDSLEHQVKAFQPKQITAGDQI